MVSYQEAVIQIDNMLRAIIKYNQKVSPQELYARFIDILNDNGIILDD